MSEYEEDNYVANDFYSLIGDAQLNELREVEKQRDAEREKIKQLAEDSGSKSMTLMQIAGMRSQKEIDAITQEKNAVEDQRLKAEEAKRKEEMNARLVNQFPPPDLKHNS